MYIVPLVVLAGISWMIFKPSEPKKPKNIPLGDYTYVIDYVDKRIDKLMKKYDLPSVVVAMIDDQDVIYKHAYGLSNVEENANATLDTIYKIGSITKLFTGIEIIRMYEKGLIDLDAPITEYLSDFSINTDFPSGPITIRSILSHRSGLPRGSALLSWNWDVRPYVLKALTDSLSDSYQAFPVGQRYKYSNIGYNILGRIIEVVNGVEPPAEITAGGWPYYMKDELLIPMDMCDTEFGSEPLLYGLQFTTDVAMGYYNDSGKNIPYDQFDIIDLASGNMQSTMNDMIKFAQYILAIEKDDENNIISGNALWAMFEEQNVRPTDPQTNGLAWFINWDLLDELVAFHSGTNQGVISLIMLMPEKKLCFIVFSNSDEFEDVQNILAIDTLKLLMETKYGTVYKDQTSYEEVNVNRAVLESYTGKYVINGEIIEIVLKNDKLKAIYQNRKINMVPISQSRFRLSHILADVEDIELEFFINNPEEEDIMIITMGDHFVCPRYQDISEIPHLWEELTGKYDIYSKIPSSYSDEEILGHMEIYIEDDVLYTSDEKILKTTNSDMVIVVGGVFSGETMLFDKQSGNITWQHLVYKPVN